MYKLYIYVCTHKDHRITRDVNAENSTWLSGENRYGLQVGILVTLVNAFGETIQIINCFN